MIIIASRAAFLGRSKGDEVRERRERGCFIEREWDGAKSFVVGAVAAAGGRKRGTETRQTSKRGTDDFGKKGD